MFWSNKPENVWISLCMPSSELVDCVINSYNALEISVISSPYVDLVQIVCGEVNQFISTSVKSFV